MDKNPTGLCREKRHLLEDVGVYWAGNTYYCRRCKIEQVQANQKRKTGAKKVVNKLEGQELLRVIRVMDMHEDLGRFGGAGRLREKKTIREDVEYDYAK